MEAEHEHLSVRRQCELLGINRASLYYQTAEESGENLRLMRRIDEQYTRCPFYGSRRLTAWLQGEGFEVNRKRVVRLMKIMGLEAVYPKPRLSRPGEGHKIYPYRLREVNVERVNQVWSTDITYIRLLRGFVYLIAVMDWFSRYVLSWTLSVSLEVDFCLRALKDALRRGRPEIFNSDQGSQFTSPRFTDELEERGIEISMDGRGRCLDNIFIERLWRTLKYEEVVCYERDCSQLGRKRCFIKDEGRPFEVGLQEQTSNHHKLRRSRAFVVSVDGKGGARIRQVRIKKANVSEPLMRCRNVPRDVETGTRTSVPRARVERSLLTAQLASGMKAARS